MAISEMTFLLPLAYLAAQKLIIILFLAFTPPTSMIRAAFFPLLIIGNYYLVPSYTLYISRSAWIGFLAAVVLTGPLDYLEKLLLSQWSFQDYGPSAELRKRVDMEAAVGAEREGWTTTQIALIQSEKKTWERLKFGTWVCISNRYIASPYQVRNVPVYSTADPIFVPTRCAFLLREGSTSLICYLLIDLMVRCNRPERNSSIYAEKYVPFFTRVGDLRVNEILERIGTTVGYWTGVYCSLQVYYSVISFVAVASGLTSPRDRRPVFGPLSNAYTIRRFWR